MNDKLISHERAKRSVQNLYDPSNGSEKHCLELLDYISQQEQFAKDVARYLELEKTSFLSPLETREYVELYGKLSKVGKEE